MADKKMPRDASGQTVQKQEVEESEPEFSKGTCHPSQKKGRYHRKRVQREHSGRERTDSSYAKTTGHREFDTKDNTFTENTGSELLKSKKVEKAQKKSQKAGQKLDKAKSKMPKKKEYTLQRVFDE